MRRHLPTAAAAAVILAAGLLHGLQTNRWALAAELQHAVDVLPRLPLEFGEWKGKDIEPDEYQLRSFHAAEILGYVMREYTHETGGETISLLIACGPTGPIATHTPEACYGGSGKAMQGEPRRVEVPGGTSAPGATFLNAQFRRDQEVAPTTLNIYWSYRGGDRWEAPDDPRMHFAGARALYKVYVIRSMAPGTDPAEDASTPRFLEALMPALEATLSGGARGS